LPANSAAAEPTFTNRCAPDPKIPTIWKAFENQEARSGNCLSPYRFVVKKLPNIVPKTAITEPSQLLPIGRCKLERGDIWKADIENRMHLTPKTVIQVVPFYDNSGTPKKSPKEEWGNITNFIVSGLKSMNDGVSEVQIRIPDSYVKVDMNISTYGLNGLVMHGDPKYLTKVWSIVNKVVKQADPQIDFTGADQVWVLGASTIKRNVLGNHIAHSQRLITNEKSFGWTSYLSALYTSENTKYFQPRIPFGILHEMQHLFNNSQDHYGNIDHGGKNVGMGIWGNMSGAITDFAVWDKWNNQWIDDSQVRCAGTQVTTFHWLKPSTISGKYEKLLMIPTSKTTAIAVESIRNSGFNYKIPLSELGALIYTIDTKKVDDREQEGMGLDVICPTNRPCKSLRLNDGALKKGDFVKISGLKITVIESGDFGDVIKVEKS
jgi:hypothetical protein